MATKRPTKASSEFKGALAAPLIVPRQPKPPSLLSSRSGNIAAEHANLMAHWRGDVAATLMAGSLEKLPALFRHYGIQPPALNTMDLNSPWHLLVIKMAHDLVPGFQSRAEQKTRKASKWTASTQASLVLDVRNWIRARDQLPLRGDGSPMPSAASACTALARKRDGKWNSQCNGNGKTLYTRYQEAMNNSIVASAFDLAGMMKRSRPDYDEGAAVDAMLDFYSKLGSDPSTAIDRSMIEQAPPGQ